MCYCISNKILIKRKTLLVNFDLTKNFDFFRLNNFGVAHGISVEFSLWTFHKLSKRQEILSLLNFGCISYNLK